MDTYFASPERSGDNELQKHIEIASNNLVINGVLNTVSGLLAVLNRNRQIISVNNALLEALDIKHEMDLVGLRPGEALHCIHADEMPGGCGTSKYCSSCGAAIAIVTALRDGRCEERKCILTAKRKDDAIDICLNVKACFISHQDEQFILLFLNDITREERRAELERSFFHDIMNVTTGLTGASEVLLDEGGCGDPEMLSYIRQLSIQLEREITIQRALVHADAFEYKGSMEDIPADAFLREIKRFFSKHPAAWDKTLSVKYPEATLILRSDRTLLRRVVINMLTNAFEASEPGQEVRLWSTLTPEDISIHVWNSTVIPENVSMQIFQRHFSTKQGIGRGIGTYSMKLFGEKVLGGTVSFTTSEGEGTVFTITLPR